MNIKLVNPSDLNVGDTILINGKMFTVGNETVKSSFCGTTICGERISGMVEQVLFKKWHKGKVVALVAQL